MTTPTNLDDIGAALGRVPSGLFIVATDGPGGAPMGFLASFVQQVALDPPTVAVAVSTDREHLAAIRSAGRFGVSILGDGDKGLMKPFFKSDGAPFDEVDSARSESGAPYLTGALAWLDCRVTGEHDAGDHVVVFGAVEGGARLRDGEPLHHVRKNGLRYS